MSKEESFRLTRQTPVDTVEWYPAILRGMSSQIKRLLIRLREIAPARYEGDNEEILELGRLREQIVDRCYEMMIARGHISQMSERVEEIAARIEKRQGRT